MKRSSVFPLPVDLYFTAGPATDFKRAPAYSRTILDTAQLADPVVRKFVQAVNAGDRAAFFALLTSDATMSDDGSERDLEEWVDREIFTSDGRMEVESQSDDGRSLIVNYTNSRWGSMRTVWKLTIEGDKVARVETGQAPKS